MVKIFFGQLGAFQVQARGRGYRHREHHLWRRPHSEYAFRSPTITIIIKSIICPDDPFPDSPPIKRTKEEAKKEEAEKGKTAERDEPTEKRFPCVQVLYPYEAEEEGELSINAGDIITVLESTLDKGFAFSSSIYLRAHFSLSLFGVTRV